MGHHVAPQGLFGLDQRHPGFAHYPDLDRLPLTSDTPRIAATQGNPRLYRCKYNTVIFIDKGAPCAYTIVITLRLT